MRSFALQSNLVVALVAIIYNPLSFWLICLLVKEVYLPIICCNYDHLEIIIVKLRPLEVSLERI